MFPLFTSGAQTCEVWSDNGGENIYHSSLDPDEYKDLLAKSGFNLIDFKINDPECTGHTVWLSQLAQSIA